MKTTYFKLSALVLLLCTGFTFSQNIIDSSSWIEGASTSNLNGFGRIGSPTENIIEIAPGPSTDNVAVWRVVPGALGVYRGFVTSPNFDNSQIDPQKSYRLSVWMKTINGNGAKIIAVLRGTTSSTFLNSSDAIAQSAYFNWGAAPTGTGWYLMVFYINGMNITDDYAAEKGFYDITGQKESGLGGPAQHRFNTTSPSFDFAFTLNNVGGVSENMLFFNPRMEEVNASMPTIQELIDTDTNSSPNNPPGGGGQWSTNANGIHYTDGLVGIGVNNPDAPLTVKGRIHASEVKVDVLGALVPDYVFYDDYNLRSLEQVQNYIDKHGHLPNIPSAAQMEKEGIELKQMNLKLLEKVEELTLYILEQQQQIEELKKLRSEVDELRKLLIKN